MIHVAVLLPQYLDLILSGEKTIECRLTKQARQPYESIEPGEKIYFKESCGPYRATATVDHVLFENDLTPDAVKQLQQTYNTEICGQDDFWNWKRDSRYATLVWLREVQPTMIGPRIANLQGRAWLALDEEPAWRMGEASVNGSDVPGANTTQHFAVPITAGNLRHNTLYATDVIDRFPRQTLGGDTRDDRGQTVTLMLHQGPTIETDIVASRKLFRTRVWGKWYEQHGAQPGDLVVFTPVDRSMYFVGLCRR